MPHSGEPTHSTKPPTSSPPPLASNTHPNRDTHRTPGEAHHHGCGDGGRVACTKREGLPPVWLRTCSRPRTGPGSNVPTQRVSFRSAPRTAPRPRARWSAPAGQRGLLHRQAHQNSSSGIDLGAAASTRNVESPTTSRIVLRHRPGPARRQRNKGVHHDQDEPRAPRGLYPATASPHVIGSLDRRPDVDVDLDLCASSGSQRTDR